MRKQRNPKSARVFDDLKSADARTREAALARLPNDRSSTRAAVRLLDDPDPFVRNATLERLRDWDARRSLPRILPRLRDSFDVARVSALECVAYWGTVAHRRFVKPLLNDSSPMVRAYAVWAIGELGGPGLEPVLKDRLQSERHPYPRAALHEALFRLTGADRHLQAILRSLSHVNYRVACFSAVSLENCLTADTRESIIAALQRACTADKRLGVRETAGKVLERIESISDVDWSAT